MNQTGTGVVWSKCLAVSSGVYAVAVDSPGYIYVAADESVTKYSSDGQQVFYSTNLKTVAPLRLAVDATGSVFILGYAGASFPPTSGAYTATGGTACAVKPSPAGGVVYAASLDLSFYRFEDGGIAVTARDKRGLRVGCIPLFNSPAFRTRVARLRLKN